MAAYESFEPPTAEWAKTVCKVGQGRECCRYLTCGPNGWSCEKHTALGRTLDKRVEEKSIGARGDNCLGRGAA
jgi:hypothetical protein